MATAAMVPIYSTTLSVATATVVIAAIPGDYKDLRLVISKTLTAQANSFIQFNSDSGANYSDVGMGFNWQPTHLSSQVSGETKIADRWGYGSTPQGSTTYMEIFDYASTNKHKSSLVRFNGMTTDGQWGMDMNAARWASNSPITVITMTLSSGQYAAGSTFSLYGIVG